MGHSLTSGREVVVKSRNEILTLFRKDLRGKLQMRRSFY